MEIRNQNVNQNPAQNAPISGRPFFPFPIENQEKNNQETQDVQQNIQDYTTDRVVIQNNNPNSMPFFPFPIENQGR
ncbi:MAG: hypothetical protein ABDH21_05270 [bacterium]